MKLRTLLLGITGMCMATSLAAQTVVEVPQGEGTLESTINADTTATGERKDPNTIYELDPGGVYLMNSSISYVGTGGTLTIRMKADAPEGSKKPLILKKRKDDIFIGENSIEGNLVLENIYYQSMELTVNELTWAQWNIVGNDHALSVDNCVFEFCWGIMFQMNAVEEGARLSIKNSYFRDFVYFNEWWEGRIFMCEKPMDELLFENNTCSGTGIAFLNKGCLVDYAMINHNTFINNHKYPFLNPYWREAYITNNLFVNANIVGEDAENVATGGQDPDGQRALDNGDGTYTTREMYMGIIGIDTIKPKQILIPSRYYLDENTLTEDIDEISDYEIYVADNVVVKSSTLDMYHLGAVGSWTGVLESYLTGGNIGTAPFKVENLPALWMNSRTEALVAEYDNLKVENNSIYQKRTSDLGFGTDPLPQDAANVFAQWNQNQWGVPDAAKPTAEELKAYYFGDYDPTTIPGVEVESAPAGEGGIVKISDFIEDFSYTANLVSESTGAKIGAQHWTDTPYNSEEMTLKVKQAYDPSIGIEDEVSSSVSGLRLQNYPNPFSSSTTISFQLDSDTHVNLSVYDISGRLVLNLVNENRGSGEHRISFEPEFAAGGLYLIRLSTAGQTVTKKMLVTK